MEYLIEGIKYSVGYQELKELYFKFTAMEDEEFLNNLSDALHFACIMCWFKEIPSSVCLSDLGIIHELTHLLCNTYTAAEKEETVKRIRKTFKEQLELK